MTVKDLLELDIGCDALDITIREEGCSKYIFRYVVGEQASCAVYDEMKINNKWVQFTKCVTPEKITDARTQAGGGHFFEKRIIPKAPKKAPDEVLNLQICSFDITTLWSKKNWHGLRINAYPEGWTGVEPKTDPQNNHKQPEGINGQLTLQINEWEEKMTCR